jgi:SAM-dependent methyltransferase
MDIRAHNRAAWDRGVERRNPWTIPVAPDAVERARHGEFSVVLTPTKMVPREWFPPLPNARVLCLASGGGQQGPILAAAGANVTVFDNSPRQLAQDQFVAQRDNLALDTIVGDMADLSALAGDSFDLIFHPISNCFVPDVRPVWRECFRVLRRGGVLLAGFTNPVRYLFDYERMERGELVVQHAIPYSDGHDLEPARRQSLIDQLEPLEFGHTLEDQIGGQLDAGFIITGFYEDTYSPAANDLLSRYLPTYIATRAVKPEGGNLPRL